jgi:E3 ubiquitin-protein ligase makorin
VRTGYCANGLSCPFIHGDICPTCGVACLNPFNEQEREQHMELCMEAVMVHQESEASRGLQCGICLETPYEAGIKFGILPNCVHVFCLDCIRSWRTNSDTFGSDAVRVCPVCRVESYFVVPCERFVDNSDPARKQKVLDCYKESLARIP